MHLYSTREAYKNTVVHIPTLLHLFKHFKMLQPRQQYHQVPHSSTLLNLQELLIPLQDYIQTLSFSPKMEGRKTQGQGYLKKKASVSYLVEEELENDTDEEVEREEDKRKGVMDRFKGSSGSSDRGSSRLCQVDRCTADLKEAKQYHRRHKVCEVHAKASSVYLSGVKQRFCQQCSRFHGLIEFDEAKRSCRRRLAGHNERRRKSSGESFGEGSSGRRGITGQVIQNQERSRVEMTLPMSDTSFKRPQIS